MSTRITSDLIIAAYQQGIFPMADGRHAKDIHWYDPPMRGILPLDAVHIPQRLQQKIKRQPYQLAFDQDFSGVITSCADVRDETWINDEIIRLYTELYKQGVAHSVEAWEGGVLVGGVYGLALGGAFFGESMFSIKTDASKIALVYLAEHLKTRGFQLFDTQFQNDHIRQFGVIEIARSEYLKRLQAALKLDCRF